MRGAGVRKGNKPGLARAHAGACEGGAGQAWAGLPWRSGRRWTFPCFWSGCWQAPQLCFLWALLSLRSGKFWQEKKAPVITEIDTFDWVGGCFSSVGTKQLFQHQRSLDFPEHSGQLSLSPTTLSLFRIHREKSPGTLRSRALKCWLWKIDSIEVNAV